MASTRNGSRRTTQRGRKSTGRSVGRSIQGESEPDIEQQIDEYDEAFLQCRRAYLGHPWQLVGFFREGGSIKRQLACGRCGTTRTDTWSRSGGRISSSYQYADGYQFTGSGGGVSGDRLRAEVLKRVVIWGNEEEMMNGLFAKSSRRRAAR